jgi:hypothetical protein
VFGPWRIGFKWHCLGIVKYQMYDTVHLDEVNNLWRRYKIS